MAFKSFLIIESLKNNFLSLTPQFKTDPGKLGHLIIDRGDNGFYERCSEYPEIKPVRESGLRVNCGPSNLLFSLIKIESLKSGGMILAEIEVHTIGEYFYFQRYNNRAE